jgi:hypothetical protein
MKRLLLLILPFLVVILFAHCTSGGSHSAPPTPPPPTTSPPPPPPPPSAPSPTVAKPIKGSVAYYCPSKMIVDQEYFVTVSIAKEQLAQLLTEMRRDVLQLNPTANTADINGDSILVTDRMKVVLVCSRDYFKVIDSPEVAEMSFGNSNKIEWEWLIQPSAVISTVPIEVRVYAYNLQGDNTWNKVNNPVKSFFINVRVDPRTFWNKSLTFLNDNPKFLLSQILIPLFSFFGGILIGRRKKKNTDGSAATK